MFLDVLSTYLKIRWNEEKKSKSLYKMSFFSFFFWYQRQELRDLCQDYSVILTFDIHIFLWVPNIRSKQFFFYYYYFLFKYVCLVKFNDKYYLDSISYNQLYLQKFFITNVIQCILKISDSFINRKILLHANFQILPIYLFQNLSNDVQKIYNLYK